MGNIQCILSFKNKDCGVILNNVQRFLNSDNMIINMIHNTYNYIFMFLYYYVRYYSPIFSVLKLDII